MALLDVAFVWAAFVGILAIVNPFSTAIVFLGITKGDSEAKKRETAKRASVVCACVLIFFMATGSLIFEFFSITIEAFQLAGGLLVTRLGFSMLDAKSKRQTEEEKKESVQKDDVSIVPLAIPMLSGPGAITTALVWMSQAPATPEKAALIIAAIAISLIAYVALIHAKVLNRVLGKTGIALLEKLMGLIVLVMGIQFIINALRVLALF